MAAKKRVRKRVKKTAQVDEVPSISSAEVVLRSARPNFLVLTVAILILLFAIVHFQGYSLTVLPSLTVIVAALLAHLAVNWLNEYHDAKSGLDSVTQKTPFSGGSGALQLKPDALNTVRSAAYISLGILVLAGLYLVAINGIELLLFGVLGVAIILLYTQFITKQPWLCLIAPGLAFGPIMMVGGFLALTGEFSLLVAALSMVPFFLVNNLLLLNQIPDLEADKTVGRYNVLMLLGLENGIQLFAAFTWLSFIVLGLVYWWFELPNTVTWGFASLIVAFPMLRQLQLYYLETDKLVPVLTMNVIITIMTPILIGIGFFLA